MDEETFWLKLWQAVIAGVCVMTFSIGGCVAHTDYRISEAIKSGADPIDTWCALSSSSTDSRCIAAAVRK